MTAELDADLARFGVRVLGYVRAFGLPFGLHDEARAELRVLEDRLAAVAGLRLSAADRWAISRE